MSFLKERAEKFLITAEFNFQKGFYDLVLFNVEQYIQLYIKYLLYVKTSDYPKSHDLIRLIRDLRIAYDKQCVEDFLKENFDIISLIQQAYISSRYLPTEYIKEHAERALSLVDKFKEMIVQCLSS